MLPEFAVEHVPKGELLVGGVDDGQLPRGADDIRGLVVLRMDLPESDHVLEEGISGQSSRLQRGEADVSIPQLL